MARCPECDRWFNTERSVPTRDGKKVCSDICRASWDKKCLPVPTVADFLDDQFLPWAESSFAARRKTWFYYRNGARRLKEYKPLASSPLDDKELTKWVSGYVARRQAEGMRISSVNRELHVPRRLLSKAYDWGIIDKVAKIEMLRGENHREFVIAPQEEAKYLAAASEPLASVATVLADTGARPEECYRLRWEYVAWLNGRHGTLFVTHGKTAAARPMTSRVRNVLEQRWKAAGRPVEGWVWPAETKSGHLEPSGVRKQHARALKDSRIRPFVLYSFRHSFLTRLGASGCDAWTLARIAGHSSIAISNRYVHPSEDSVLAAVEKLPAPATVSATVALAAQEEVH